ncbi:MAG: type II toxin-antitoxin system Phd/YefM family antitoxin [Gammaproteobacteria bacterium]
MSMKTISAADANRHFSRLLREVASGETIIVTSRGKSVATMGPLAEGQTERHAARQALLQRLTAQSATGKRRWTREELYEDLA